MTALDRVEGIRRGRPLPELARSAGRLARARASDVYWAARGRRTVTVADLSVTFRLVDRDDARFLRRFLAIEGTMLADLLDELRAGDVFWDVGAAGGFYTCFVSTALGDGRVVAFEPNPDVRTTLYRRTEALGVEPRVFGCALAEAEGTRTLDNPDRERASWQGTPSLVTSPNADHAQGSDGLTVETRTGDGLVAAGEAPPPTVVKIDVEGAESLVIEGLSETLAREGCRLVYCEVHRESEQRRSPADYGSSPAGVEGALAELGFAVERIEDRGGEYLVKAARR